MYRLKGRPPGQVKATALGTDASPLRSVLPGCSTSTGDAHSPIGKRLGPAPPTPAPPRAGRVTLRAPPRWRSGHTHGLLGGPLSPFLPAESPQRGVLPKVQSPPGPRSSRASRRPGTSGAHGAGDCRRSRRRRSPVSQPPLARPEPRRVPPRRACALETPPAGAGPERAAEVTR